MVKVEYKDCCDCFFDDCECDEYPCTHCKNNMRPSDPKYQTTPLLWSPKGVSVEASVSSVDHPTHYNQGGIECIDAMLAAFGEEAVKNFCLVNAFKYVWRSREKNGVEDIDKAIWYLNKYKGLNGNG